MLQTQTTQTFNLPSLRLYLGSFCQCFTITLQILVLQLNTRVTAAAATLMGLLLCGALAGCPAVPVHR